MQCRTFPYQVADGASNMALDEALLDALAGDPSHAMLRTYGWEEPTLSLGYFQTIAEAEADPRWRDVPIVRRPTGGGAIWHHHELTYALALPAAHPLARPSVELYRAVHSSIATMLRNHRVDAQPRGTSPRPSMAGRPFLCFTDRDPEDLVFQGAKIVGSAQRRRSGAILQHGSILLRRSPRTPELPGSADLAPTSSDPRYWSGIVGEGLPRALGLTASFEDVPDSVRERADDLERLVYRDRAWNRRR